MVTTIKSQSNAPKSRWKDLWAVDSGGVAKTGTGGMTYPNLSSTGTSHSFPEPLSWSKILQAPETVGGRKRRGCAEAVWVSAYYWRKNDIPLTGRMKCLHSFESEEGSRIEWAHLQKQSKVTCVVFLAVEFFVLCQKSAKLGSHSNLNTSE